MAEEANSRRPTQAGLFTTTHWSVVLAAIEKGTPEAATALERLCRTYWYPLYAYARRAGRNPQDAEDLTQSFFARLLAKDYLKPVCREKGRFRTFLLTAWKRFLANEWDHQHAQKRGGFARMVAIDQDLAESRFAAEPSHNLRPDVLYDRQWALTLLEQTMNQLEQEYLATGRLILFQSLQNCLAKTEPALPYAETAARLGLTEAAVKMVVHRLRARYREILQDNIAETVSSPEEVQEEIHHLFASFES
jgi:RNA polymerase sigma factor (sigma-70 family)